MDIGKELERITAEPLESPIPNRPAHPQPEHTPEPEHDREHTPELELLVPA